MGSDPITRTSIRYRFNRRPRRLVALSGVLLVKGMLLVPHLIALVALELLTIAAMYVGWVWTVATGKLPRPIQHLVGATAAWWVRIRAWYLGVTDEYPPFEMDAPPRYLPALDVPINEDPSRAWALAGIVLVKVLAVAPFLILMVTLEIVLLPVAWLAALIVLTTGQLPIPLQDFCVGTGQWGARVVTWLAGIEDRYPRFDLEVHPIDHTVEVTVAR